MSDSMNLPERLFEARTRYTERFGPIHPILANLSPEILVVVLEVALEGRVEVDARSIEQALAEVDTRMTYLMEQLNR